MNHVIVWKTQELPHQSIEILKTWKGFRTSLFTDRDCELLAKQWKCDGYFRQDLMNITRADICRYMATWEVGGVYSDLDVKVSGPFDAHCADLCVGNEYRRHLSNIANHFFIAAKHSPCLQIAIRETCQNAKIAQMDFAINPHIVHHIAGPNAFDKAVKHCAHNAFKYPRFLRHMIASNKWNGPGYKGWVYERMARAKWKHIYEYRR